MEVQLIRTETPNLALRRLVPIEGNTIDQDSEPAFKFNSVVAIAQEDSKLFMQIFDIELISFNSYSLNLEFVAWFKSNEEVNEEFVQSPFARINIPAIAFPFLRSSISHLLLNAGYKPAFLPSINFVKLYEEEVAASKS
jgi:preprotein translocase subunit SecB